jgi:hypothetical protein
MFNVQRQMTGMKSEAPPQANTVKAMLDANKRDTNYEAPGIKPYPLNMADDVLANMYTACLNLKKIIETTDANPALKDKFKGQLQKVYKMNNTIAKSIVDLSAEVDKIG